MVPRHAKKAFLTALGNKSIVIAHQLVPKKGLGGGSPPVFTCDALWCEMCAFGVSSVFVGFFFFEMMAMGRDILIDALGFGNAQY